jgi:hypothetical protein
VEAKLNKAGIIGLIGRENFFKEFEDVVAICKQFADHAAQKSDAKIVLGGKS